MSNKIPRDQSQTLEINNDEIESMMEQYADERTVENLNRLVGMFHKGRVIVPANMGPKKQPAPYFITNQEGKIFLPVFTSKKQLTSKISTPYLLNIPYIAANTMALQDGLNCEGIVVNPFSNNLVFRKELLVKIDEVEKKRQAAGGTGPVAGKKVQMTEQEYMAYELRQFGGIFLPKILFEKAKEFVDELCDRKEACVDELFEASYQQKRLYPYLEEEFAVMPMDMSEEQLIVRIDMPTRDASVGSCDRVYLVWDKVAEKGRYFTIERAAKGYIIGEVTSELHHLNYGEAPVEGAEIQRILEMMENEKFQTS